MVFKFILPLIAAFFLVTPALAEKPPRCIQGHTCSFYGKGGDIKEWKAAADKAILNTVLYAKDIIVPRNKPCWSACVLAIGYLLDKGIEVKVHPKADVRFKHDDDPVFTKWLSEQPMPKWLRDRALSK